jgi:hypothetical protein
MIEVFFGTQPLYQVGFSNQGGSAMREQAVLSDQHQYGPLLSMLNQRRPLFATAEDPVARLQGRLLVWLKSLGMDANPFDAKYLDAGSDPFLASYLVGHHAFQAIRQPQPSLCFAPVGGGKSAFRVRLARACRVNEDGQQVLPLVYTLSNPTKLTQGNILEQHLHFLNQRFAVELLFTLAYRPDGYLAQPVAVRRQISAHLQANFPGAIETQLQQVTAKGDLLPLIKLADPSAGHLIALPSRPQLDEFCKALQADLAMNRALSDEFKRLTPASRFQRLVEITKDELGRTAIYILVDGVDAYVEAMTPQRKQISDLLMPLAQQTALWTKMQVYVKYFLPTEFVQILKLPDFVASGAIVNLKLVHIEWTPTMLAEVLQERIRFASHGHYTTLDQICAADLSQLQQQIVAAAKPLPREVLVLAERVLLAHVERTREPDLLEQIDFDAAKAWYDGGGR